MPDTPQNAQRPTNNYPEIPDQNTIYSVLNQLQDSRGADENTRIIEKTRIIAGASAAIAQRYNVDENLAIAALTNATNIAGQRNDNLDPEPAKNKLVNAINSQARKNARKTPGIDAMPDGWARSFCKGVRNLKPGVEHHPITWSDIVVDGRASGHDSPGNQR